MLNGFGIKFKVPHGYTLAKFRRDKKQAHSFDRYLASMTLVSDKFRVFNDLIRSHFGF